MLCSLGEACETCRAPRGAGAEGNTSNFDPKGSEMLPLPPSGPMCSPWARFQARQANLLASCQDMAKLGIPLSGEAATAAVLGRAEREADVGGRAWCPGRGRKRWHLTLAIASGRVSSTADAVMRKAGPKPKFTNRMDLQQQQKKKWKMGSGVVIQKACRSRRRCFISDAAVRTKETAAGIAPDRRANGEAQTNDDFIDPHYLAEVVRKGISGHAEYWQQHGGRLWVSCNLDAPRKVTPWLALTSCCP